MRIFRFIIILTELLICYLLESIVMVHMSYSDIIPDLLIIIVVGCGYMFGSNQGMIYGFLSGLIIDLSGQTSIGFAAFLYVLIGFFAGLFRKFYKRSDCITPLAITAFGEFVFLSVYYVINFLTKGNTGYSVVLKGIILPKITLTVLCAAVLYKLFQLSVNFTRRGELAR